MNTSDISRFSLTHLMFFISTNFQQLRTFQLPEKVARRCSIIGIPLFS